MRQAVKDDLNGEYDNVDPNLRRAVMTLATGMDDLSARWKRIETLLFATATGVVSLLATVIFSLLTR